jgi:hypothetical protein
MDATRPRRTRDSIRQGWYARQRSLRFARHFGFPLTAPAPESQALLCNLPSSSPCLTLSGPIEGRSSLVLAGEVFVHVAHLGALASLLWPSLVWRSSEWLCRFPWRSCVTSR